MFKAYTPKLYTRALALTALLFACGAAAAAQEAQPKSEPQTATVQDAAAATKTDATAAAAAPEATAPAASKEVSTGGSRIEFETRGASEGRAAELAKATTELPLFVSDRFEWRQSPDPQASPTPQSTYTPLTPGQKMRRAGRNAFLSPVGYATTIFGAAVTEYTEDDLPHKTTEDRFADFASRFAIRFTTRASNTLLGQGVYAVAFKQDPRYHPSKSKNFIKRAAWAASRVFVTYDDDGNSEPNVSRWAGSLTSSAIANLYEQSTPGRDRIGTDATFRRFAASFTSGMLTNIIREFIKL